VASLTQPFASSSHLQRQPRGRSETMHLAPRGGSVAASLRIMVHSPLTPSRRH
jgi:hypothetical protein